MRWGSRVVGALACAMVPLALAGPASAAGIRAGAAVVDATWHVGASAGQYASDGFPLDADHADPTLHSTRRASSYGVQSRLNVRALVVEGADGKRVAFVKDDLYIPQDLLRRRAVQILASGTSGITTENLVLAVTHDHSSPYYSSPSWGLWAFQDVIDLRFYEYYAQRIAEAVEKAAGRLEPARVSAAVTQLDKVQRHSFGPALADDGTPAGYPISDADHDLTVVRFDNIRVSEHPRPIALLVNYSLHGEGNDGNDLISGDWVAPMQRMIDRASGAVTVFTQNAVGTAEMERSTYHSVHDRLDFSHRNYAQNEYAARLIADAALDTMRAAGDPDRQEGVTRRAKPFYDGKVDVLDHWFPGPLSHPYPGVSNCRTDRLLHGNPQLPLVGLPDCMDPISGLSTTTGLLGLPDPPPNPLPPIDPGIDTDDLEAAGIPVPENYGVPGYTGLEENFSIHLQAVRLGGILFTVCSCEQWADQARNIKTRTDREQGNEYLGYDWSAQCTPGSGGTWTCPNPSKPGESLPPISDHAFRKMKAQVENDAKGWDDPAYVAQAESEPADPAQIKGNYTHSELPASQGYELTVPISMANDYNGYIATYREYQRGDHYRKALTGWGPHSSDYLASNLVAMAGALNGGPALARNPLDAKTAANLVVADQEAAALGRLGSTAITAYEATLPDDGGTAQATEQPKDIERFAAAFFSWNGGSNFTDQPVVVVQRLVRGAWTDYADQSGEIPVTLKFPATSDLPGYLTDGQQWIWTATFEAFVSPFDTGARPRGTPAGTYRFAVRGLRRSGGKAVPYALTSHEFHVAPWSGITVDDLRIDPDGRASFTVGPRSTRTLGEGDKKISSAIGPIDYPDSYTSPVRFIHNQLTGIRDPDAPSDGSKVEWYCFTCTFRPWIDVSDAVEAGVTVVPRHGRPRTFAATEHAGRWVTARRIPRGATAYVAAGAVEDRWGNVNGRESARVTR